jgi:hypothetical protein
MEKKKINVRLNKIPIKELVNNLIDLYERGADYFDILGINNVNQDVIGISIKEEYMASGDDNEEEYEEDDDTRIINLSEEDLNKLL